MSELNSFILTGVLTQNFNNEDLVKFLKFFLRKASHFNCNGYIDNDIMYNHEPKTKNKKRGKR